MIVLLVVGIGVFVAGLVTAAFGIPVKEFSFGNTLILSGAVVSCTGLIMISLALVVRELRAAADRLSSGIMTADRGGDLRVLIPPGRGIKDSRPPLWDADQAAPNARNDPTVTPSVPSPPWQAEMSTRDRAVVGAVPNIPAAEPPAFSDTPASPKQRRNLLFASSMRRERDGAMAERSGPAVSQPAPGTHAPDLGVSRPASFEDGWPRSERSRPEPESAPAASSAGARADRFSGLHGQSASAVTVLRSGVVDGMAYSLYSDGTIEAQLPEGMMRFASIDQLRAHLDQGPDRTPPK